MPHRVGHRDGEALRGGCREADLRRCLEELEQIARDRDRMLGMDRL
jgi:hypothetical protein